MRAIWSCVAVVVCFAALPGICENVRGDGGRSEENIDRWIRDLGAQTYSVREDATRQLLEAGARAVEKLREALDGTQDPEVHHRLRKILYAATLQVRFEELSPQAKDVARSPFETSIDDQGTRASRKTYCMGDYGISDIGNIRIAVKGLPFGGHSSSSLPISNISEGSSGSTGSGNRRFTTTSANGVLTCTFGDLHFTVSEETLRIDGRAFSFGEAYQVIFVSREGKIEGILDLAAQPEEKPGQ